jgi:hypothetical protein
MDWMTKLLLLAIAVGLWLNAAAAWVHPAAADDNKLLSVIGLDIMDIKDNVRDLATGHCVNQKLCP